MIHSLNLFGKVPLHGYSHEGLRELTNSNAVELIYI